MNRFFGKYVCICLLAFFSSNVLAQDILELTSKEKLQVKVTEINPTSIRYKSWDNQDGPVYTLEKTEISSITYQNGKIERFIQETKEDAKPSKYAKAEDKQVEIPASNVEKITVYGVTFRMIRVEPGSFVMGCTEDQKINCDEDERPKHKVTLDEYYIGQTEVTQELWYAVMDTKPSKFTGARLPIEQVTWEECMDFITRLNDLTGQKFRLPTEAEWEFAARGGLKSKKSMYSGSDNINEVACFSANSSDRTRTIAYHKPNELGIYDMSGNVCEWTSDAKTSYTEDPQNNPHFTTGTEYVIRGGSWLDAANSCRVTYRDYSDPNSKTASVGFRLAK